MSATDECPRCALYAHTRGARILREIEKTSVGEEAERRWVAFLQGYHDLHVKAGRFVALMALVAADPDPDR